MNKTSKPARRNDIAASVTFAPGAVRVTGGFWRNLMETNRRASIPAAFRRCEETGRIDALRLAWKPGEPNMPHVYWDSDVAKLIEACCYSLALQPDPVLEAKVDEVISLFAAAQQPDGYLNSYYTTVAPKKRWTNLRDNHELYCAGHIFEAAVAHFETTGKTNFLDVACKYADCICEVFGRGEGQIRGYPGHQEIELALVRLYYATKRRRYLELAVYFLDERGSQPHYYDTEAKARGEDPRKYWLGTYEHMQSHAPVREQRVPVGHAVRLAYMCTGMAATAGANGDRSLFDASARLWKTLTSTQMLITGGIGQIARNEGFTTSYDLPNEGAYLETCASIGMVFWGHRMLDWASDSSYSDVVERALYNGVISGVAVDGKHFFYGNPLAVHPGFDGNGTFIRKGYHYRRQEWFGCSCCPTNIARMLARFPAFLYTSRGDELAVHQYAESDAALCVAGMNVRVLQSTQYPWDGSISVAVEPESEATWTMALRIPGWCRNASVRVNGRRVAVAKSIKQGYVRINRRWMRGDVVALELPMPVERIEAHPSVRQDSGRVAICRGPVVYCIESVDNGNALNGIELCAVPKFAVELSGRGLLRGVPIIKANASRRKEPSRTSPLYTRMEAGAARMKECTVTAIPYYLWGNRKPGEMIVWIRQGGD